MHKKGIIYTTYERHQEKNSQVPKGFRFAPQTIVVAYSAVNRPTDTRKRQTGVFLGSLQGSREALPQHVGSECSNKVRIKTRLEALSDLDEKGRTV